MTNQEDRFTNTRRALRKAALVLSAFSFGTAGCNAQPTTPQQQEQEDTATASFSIKAADFYAFSAERSLSAFSSLRSAQAFAFSDVSSIRIDVKDKDSNNVLYVNFDLFLSAGEWTGSVPFLPKNKALVFSAKAFNSSGTLLFLGTTEQTLSINNDSVVVALAAANDGQSITIARIKKISVPSAFGSDQSGNVSFSVEANTGETLSYELTPATGGGTFYPITGSITLSGTAGTFVSQFAPPTVTENAEFEHTVRVTNEAGHSVTTTFKTKVKKPGTTDGVKDSVVQVLYNPVINSLNASRVLGTGNVIFQAAVADDSAEEDLTYAWSFTAADGTSFDPMPAFTGGTNPSTLESYTPLVQGSIKLEVTDTDGGKTTLYYPLTPNQFPDNPLVEGGVTGFNSIRAGENHTCALLNNGTLRCWGLNGNGQLGYGNTFTIGDNELPYTAGDVALVGVGARIALGGNHTCALFDTGLVRCWGHNGSGQLGYNTTEHVGDGEAIASYGYVNLGGVATKISAGASHTCALMDTGKVRCWGYNSTGQLGYGNTQNVGDNEQPWSVGDVQVGGTVKDIVAGGYHTCAVLETGFVRCWGYNGYGQLGYGNTTNISVPASAGDVNTDSKVLQVAAGSEHTCALLSTGGIKCWGYGVSGRLGYGNTAQQRSPPSSIVDLGGSTAFQVTTGGAHTCALLSTGAARCWGEAGSGQLGYGNTDDIGDNEHPSTAGDIQVLAPTP